MSSAVNGDVLVIGFTESFWDMFNYKICCSLGRFILLGRLGVLLLILLCVGTSRLSAQVVECPGFLPSSNIDKAKKLAMARRLLGRFISVLDLHGLDAIDEQLIMTMYHDHPEQLAIKLSYLGLQCQMVVLESDMTRPKRQEAVRRVFLDYILAPPDTGSESLTAYVNAIAAEHHSSALASSVTAIEQARDRSSRRQWQEQWFPIKSASEIDRSSETDHWSVIVSSPRYEDEGWGELRRHQQSWPEVYFELDGPFDLESPFYAVVAGRDLAAQEADGLLDLIKAKGMANDAFRWRAPDVAGGSSSRVLSDGLIKPIKPTPPRPTLSDIGGASLSQ